MTPLPNHSHWFFTVHRQDRDYDPNIQNNENFRYTHYTENVYGRNVVRGNGYNYFVYSVSTNGKFSEGIGGNAYCPLKEPLYLESSYADGIMTLRWRPVEGAVAYAVRVDNTSNGWNLDNVLPGDWRNDFVQGAEYRFPIGLNQQVRWWVHAIDKNNVWSKSSVVKTHYRTR
jgi:hypothetical protein